MAKKKQYFDPRTGTYTDKPVKGAKPVDQATLTQAEGHGPGFAVPAFGANPRDYLNNDHPFGVEVTATPHKTSDAFGVGAGSSKQAANVGGGKSYDPEEMIRTYLPGLTPEQQGFIRTQLRGAEKGSGADYHKALDALSGSHPGLQQFTPWSKLFPQQKAGQLSPEVMTRLLQLTQQYQKPYLDQLNTISAGVSGSLQKLLPSLPASYKGLIQSEIPVYANLGKQLGAAISAGDPGMIASAYGQAYAPAASQTQANALFNSIPGLSS